MGEKNLQHNSVEIQGWEGVILHNPRVVFEWDIMNMLLTLSVEPSLNVREELA